MLLRILGKMLAFVRHRAAGLLFERLCGEGGRFVARLMLPSEEKSDCHFALGKVGRNELLNRSQSVSQSTN